MKKLFQSSQFLKDIKRIKKRGKDIKKLQTVVNKLANNETLHPKYRDHPLMSEWKPCRDCHIEPDWLLVYYSDSNILRLERTGSHSDLFK
ncbi:MAG: type II toxin-antitoxin system YafQ family toxin [Candidatus Scalindua sp.]|jgi:mRNA interferase YafQ|nr:type II toxin-antitoxin system YafQ family toxin [Candidatus Scalindua sp.]|tara:strand:+ start:401 stop:670 length:270 start_codon:yes stop_codon:yes gene_type:complete